jgi:hypothetical protein
MEVLGKSGRPHRSGLILGTRNPRSRSRLPERNVEAQSLTITSGAKVAPSDLYGRSLHMHFVGCKRCLSQSQSEEDIHESKAVGEARSYRDGGTFKKHGDKIDRGRLGGIDKENASGQKGGAGEPEVTPLEPEQQGGIGGP